MMHGRYITPASIRWCQDSSRILVIDEGANLAVSLTGLEAALWKWLGLAYPYQDVAAFAQAYLNLPAEETQSRLSQVFTQWIELGILAPEGEE
jgi:hypothetical protein